MTKPKRQRAHRNQFHQFYSAMDILCASNTAAIPQDRRDLTMAKFWRAFEGLKTEEAPDPAHWVTLTEALNLMDAFVREGFATDPDNLMGDAAGAMRMAARHMEAHGCMPKMEGEFAASIAGMLHDFEVCFAHISQRSFMEVFNRTERELWAAAHTGKPTDVEVFDFKKKRPA